MPEKRGRGRPPIYDNASALYDYLRQHTDLDVTTIYSYICALRWYVNTCMKGNWEPNAAEVRQGLEYLLQHRHYKFGVTRHAWNLYQSFERIRSGKVLPFITYKATWRKGKPQFGEEIPSKFVTYARLMVSDYKIPMKCVSLFMWKSVDWNSRYLGDGVLVDIKDYRGKWYKVPVQWLDELKVWAQPKADTDPLIPVSPGSTTAYPIKKLLSLDDRLVNLEDDLRDSTN